MSITKCALIQAVAVEAALTVSSGIKADTKFGIKRKLYYLGVIVVGAAGVPAAITAVKRAPGCWLMEKPAY